MYTYSVLAVRSARFAAQAYANALGHRMGRWDTFGASKCDQCGAVLAQSDAIAFVAESSVSALGSLSAPCLHGEHA